MTSDELRHLIIDAPRAFARRANALEDTLAPIVETLLALYLTMVLLAFAVGLAIVFLLDAFDVRLRP